MPKRKLKASAIFPLRPGPMLGALWLTIACASAPDTEIQRAAETGPLLLRPALAIIRRHRQSGTHLDGPRCPMYPSCAAYAERAIRRRSLLGLLLAVDRLFFREGPGLDRRYLFAPPRLSEHLRLYDPFEDSDIGTERRPSLLKEEFRRLPPRDYP